MLSWPNLLFCKPKPLMNEEPEGKNACQKRAITCLPITFFPKTTPGITVFP